MKTRTRQSARIERESGVALLQRFLLEAIKTDAGHEAAVEIVVELLGRKLDTGASDYLDTLIFSASESPNSTFSYTSASGISTPIGAIEITASSPADSRSLHEPSDWRV